MHTSMMMAVNSPSVAHRDISGTSTTSYRPYNEEYAQIHRCVDRPNPSDYDQERNKKDKKWSIGKLFRRKKKEEVSGSSSESEDANNSQSLSKKKARKKKRNLAVSNFDHIVIRDSRRAQSLAKPSNQDITDDGVLSDPSAGFLNYRQKSTDNHRVSKESLGFKDENFSKSGKPATEGPTRKTRKGRLKARVEALRNSMRGESSSDEDSLKSSNSSSMIRFRSDDSLMHSRDSSLNKKSRNARNERYIKRLSRDEENQLNKEAELLQQGYTKAEVEMLTRTPTSQSSGYGTCKREQSIKNNHEQPNQNDVNRRSMKSESVTSFPSTQSYPSSINFNAKVNNDHINYSIPYPVRTNREPLYANNTHEKMLSNQHENPENVMCVKFPLGNVTNIKNEERSPPVPPPRDMQRKIVTPISMYYENNSIVPDRMSCNQNTTRGVHNNDFERIMRRSQERSLSHGLNGMRRPLSNSEDHIAIQNNEYMQSSFYKNEQPRRPASVSAEPHHYGIYMNTPQWRKKIEQLNSHVVKPEPIQVRPDYLYYADHSPRSRRPISIKTGQKASDNQYLSDSQTSMLNENAYRRPRNASEFWKKLDDAERHRKQQSIYVHNMTKNNTDSYNNIQFRKATPSDEQNKSPKKNNENSELENKNKHNFNIHNRDLTDGSRMWKATTEYKRSVTVEPPKTIMSPTSKTHMRHKSDTFLPNTYSNLSDDEKSSERRKSTNLDDALNELEAIYNSLGLGDEDLLDRAERRESMTPKFKENFNDWNGNGNEIQLRSQPTTPLRRIPRRSTLPDKLQDDMAFRRLNSISKDKSNIKDTQGQISYMLASPVYVPYASEDDRNCDPTEPDIVHDDVVYRNIKQTNNRLKTIDPQPPFGIPLGPVSPAPQSDYLHATPENIVRSRFVPRRSPDLVSDDLAYRSLRKDNRHSSVFSGDDFKTPINNNHSYSEFPLTNESAARLKKKRAVRSLSANIFTMIQKEIDDALHLTKLATLQKTNSNSDVMKRLRDTFENNGIEKDNYPRNKVKHRHNTVNIFHNNPHTPTHHFAKDDSYLHNGDKYIAKPPSCDKSKSSSPSNRSPPASKRCSKDEFQQVLTMLAQEAMDTSNKLGVALAELDKNRNSVDKRSDIQNKIGDSRCNFLNELRSKPEDTTTKPKSVDVNSEMPNNKKLNIGASERCKGKKTEDSLLVISDQLNKVEDKLKHSFEKDLNNEDKSLNLSNFITETKNPTKAHEDIAATSDSDLIPKVVSMTVQNDSVQVDNFKNSKKQCDSSLNIESQSIEINPLNPFLNANEKLNEINEINAFNELKNGISDLIAGISEVNEKVFVSKTPQVNLQSDHFKITGMTEASEKLNEATQITNKEETRNRASVNLSIYEDDLEVKKDATDSTEYNSSEELATIFKNETLNSCQTKTTSENQNCQTANVVRDDLSSPKLVKSMNQHLRRLSVDHSEDSSSQSNSLPTSIVPWRTKSHNHNSQKENRGEN